MTIYHEGSRILDSHSNSPNSTSLKSIIYSEYAKRQQKQGDHKGKAIANKSNGTPKDRAAPGMLYALVINALKHQEILNEIISNSGILKVEKKLNHTLALLLLHDHLLSKSKIVLSKNHPLREAIERNKARLSAEFTKARIRRGFTSTDAYLASTSQEGSSRDGVDEPRIARWVRVNRIKATIKQVLSQRPFSTYIQVQNLAELWDSDSPEHDLYYVDQHIPNLLAFHPSKTSEITSHTLYRSGVLILQDKASCFPAYILSPPPGAYVIDACAAPGNKTTHLAAIMAAGNDDDDAEALACGNKDKNLFKGKIIAFEKDSSRAATLVKMVDKAKAGPIVRIMKGVDFLTTGKSKSRPESDNSLFLQDDMRQLVTHILLDPSCSGSGITGRHITEPVFIPFPNDPTTNDKTSYNKKRKRNNSPIAADTTTKKIQLPLRTIPTPSSITTGGTTSPLEEHSEVTDTQESLQFRLQSLSSFQYLILTHSFNPSIFPSAKKITYSTCSIYPQENEHVVVSALLSDVALDNGWEIDANPYGMAKWRSRGDREEVKRKMMEIAGESNGRKWMGEEWVGNVTNGCVKLCQEDGTGGFFVACFVRKGGKGNSGRKEICEAALGINENIRKEQRQDDDDSDDYLDDGMEWRGFDD